MKKDEKKVIHTSLKRRRTSITRIVPFVWSVLIMFLMLWGLQGMLSVSGFYERVDNNHVNGSESEESTTIFTSGDYQYKVLENGTAEISGYVGLGGKITIPTSLDGRVVSRIGDIAFADNETITGVVIESGIKEMGRSCFFDCINLVSVYIPDSVKSMGLNCFVGNEKLKEVRLPNNLSSIPSGTFCWCVSLEEIKIPNTVKEIKESSFSNCINLVNVYCPDSVTVIGNGAFYGCKNLERVRLSPYTDAIVESAFQNTEKLKWITNVDWRVLNISTTAAPISKLTEEEWIHIGDYAFENSLLGCNIIVGKNNNLIGDEVFSGNTKLYGKVGTDIEYYATEYGNTFRSYLAVDTIKLNTSTASLSWNYNKTLQLSSQISPSSATITQVGYYSSNPKVAKVDGEGKVTALSEGKARITAVSLDSPSKVAHCEVTVNTELLELSVSKKSVTLSPGKSNGQQLTVTPSPKSIKSLPITWSSSDKTVATVNQLGKVIGHRPGTAVITAKSGRITTYCKVIVTPSSLSGLILQDQTTSSISLKWKKVTGVSGYTLLGYDTKTKKYRTISHISSSKNTYQLHRYLGKVKLTSGTSYSLYLKPYKTIKGIRYYGTGMKLKVATMPDKVKITSLYRMKSNSKSLKVKWGKVKRASGYMVYVSTNKGKSYQKVGTVKGTSKTYYQLKNLKRNTTYYIRIYAYKSVGTKVIKGEKSKVRYIRVY